MSTCTQAIRPVVKPSISSPDKKPAPGSLEAIGAKVIARTLSGDSRTFIERSAQPSSE